MLRTTKDLESRIADLEKQVGYWKSQAESAAANGANDDTETIPKIRHKKKKVDEENPTFQFLPALEALDRDFTEALKNKKLAVSYRDIRFLVDLYYSIQRERCAANNQIDAVKREEAAHLVEETKKIIKTPLKAIGVIAEKIKMDQDSFKNLVLKVSDDEITWKTIQKALEKCTWKGDGEPIYLVKWFFAQFEYMEKALHKILDVWSRGNLVCTWIKSNQGMGPVIASGLVADIDIKKAATAGAIWRFVGIDPTVKWLGKEGAAELIKKLKKTTKKPEDAIETAAKETNVNRDSIRRFALQYGEGEITWASLQKSVSRCPWNANLKTLVWKIGDCICKTWKKPDSVYGKIYKDRKLREEKLNEQGKFKDQADEVIASKRRISAHSKSFYKRGLLPPIRIEQRARRYAVKIFLSHLHHAMYLAHYGKEPPKPFALAHLGHTHYFAPPNMHIIEEAIKKGPGQ